MKAKANATRTRAEIGRRRKNKRSPTRGVSRMCDRRCDLARLKRRVLRAAGRASLTVNATAEPDALGRSTLRVLALSFGSTTDTVEGGGGDASRSSLDTMNTMTAFHVSLALSSLPFPAPPRRTERRIGRRGAGDGSYAGHTSTISAVSEGGGYSSGGSSRHGIGSSSSSRSSESSQGRSSRSATAIASTPPPSACTILAAMCQRTLDRYATTLEEDRRILLATERMGKGVRVGQGGGQAGGDTHGADGLLLEGTSGTPGTPGTSETCVTDSTRDTRGNVANNRPLSPNGLMALRLRMEEKKLLRRTMKLALRRGRERGGANGNDPQLQCSGSGGGRPQLTKFVTSDHQS